MLLNAFCNPLSPLDDAIIILIVLKCPISLCLYDRGTTLRNLYGSIKFWSYLLARHCVLVLIRVQNTYDAVLPLIIMSYRFFWIFKALNWIVLSFFDINRCSSLIKLVSALYPLSLFYRLSSLGWDPLFRSNRSNLHDPCAELLFLLLPLLLRLSIIVLSWALIIIELFHDLMIFLWDYCCLRLRVIAGLMNIILTIHRLHIQRCCSVKILSLPYDHDFLLLLTTLTSRVMSGILLKLTAIALYQIA